MRIGLQFDILYLFQFLCLFIDLSLISRFALDPLP